MRKYMIVSNDGLVFCGIHHDGSSRSAPRPKFVSLQEVSNPTMFNNPDHAQGVINEYGLTAVVKPVFFFTEN